MCGLVGFYPKKGKKVDLPKLYNLWIFNEERGTHSCGIVYGEDRNVGVGSKAKARNFIKEVSKELRETNLTNKPIICHTRHATAGAHTANNAHPFSWFKGKESNYFCFAHNGVIRNLEELKTKLGMDRHKQSLMDIDSQVLGLAMFDAQDGLITEKEIVENYDGNAAFICYNSANEFKVWKGANNNVEERPLYYVEAKEGWYFCSIDFPLEINFLIEPTLIPNNTMLTFKNYQLESSVVYSRTIKSTLPESRVSKKYGYGYDFADDIDYTTPDKIISNDRKINSLVIDNVSEKVILETFGVDKLRYCYNFNPISDTMCFTANKERKLSLIPTQMGRLIRFDDGVILKHMFYKQLCAVFSNHFVKCKNYEDLFHSMQYVIAHNIVDFIPFFGRDGQILVIYYKDGEKINYVTANDNCTLKLPSVFDIDYTIHINKSYISIHNEEFSRT